MAMNNVFFKCTPKEDFVLARKLNSLINLDDITILIFRRGCGLRKLFAAAIIPVVILRLTMP